MDEFLDVRRHGFARVSVCVPEVRPAEPDFNAGAHLRVLDQAYAAGAMYAVCPELGLSGYTAGDLLPHDVLLRGCLAALERIAAWTAGKEIAVSVGLPLQAGGLLFNCAVTLCDGRPVMASPKSYPPNYREFYELRWFQPAEAAPAAEIELLGATIPFGADILATVPAVEGFVLHTDVCEDLWVPVPPSTLAALNGATVLSNLSASNVTVGKFEYRRSLVTSSAAKNLAVQLYSAAGFGESTADLAWDGHGLIADRGELLAENQRYTIGGSVETADCDLLALRADRMRMTSWGQNARHHRRAFRTIALPIDPRRCEAAPFSRLLRHVDPHPYVPSNPATLDERCAEVFRIMSTSLARRLLTLREGRRNIVLGVSGGRDSTLALIVAIRALDLLKLPRTALHGISMPGFGTSQATFSIARRLVEAVGATYREADIRGVSRDIFGLVGHDAAVEDVTFENVQAWSRKFVLFSTASQEGGIDLGTGDLSEMALGWSTYGADHMSHYAVNSGVPKTLVSRLIEWSADTVFRDDPVAPVLRDVLATPISPELLSPLPSGEVAQRTEDLLGPYALHDFFLYAFTRFGFGPRRVARMALQAFEGTYDLKQIREAQILFLTRFFANQFKRDCTPDSPKVGSGGSLSPRGDWRMPADAFPAAWLVEAESIPASE